MRLHVCIWKGVVGALGVDLRSLEGYFVFMKVGESSQIWGVGGVSVVDSLKEFIDAVVGGIRLHVCSWKGVAGALDVDLRSLEGYFVRMKVIESSDIWGVGGVSGVVLSK